MCTFSPLVVVSLISLHVAAFLIPLPSFIKVAVFAPPPVTFPLHFSSSKLVLREVPILGGVRQF